MSRYKFLDKRNQNGEILKFDHHIYNQKLTEKYFDLVSNSEIYKLLCKRFPKKYIDSYFKKDFFLELLPVSWKIIVHEQETKKQNHNNKTFIKTGSCSYTKLLKIIINNNNLVFKNGIILKNLIKDFINIIRPFYYTLINIKRIFEKKEISDFSEKKNYIAVCYAEGISKEKRSDLFWLNSLDKTTNNTLVYVQYPSLLKKHEEKKALENLKKEKKIRYIKIWELKKYEKNLFYKNIKKDILRVHNKNDLDETLLKKSFELLDKIEFWQNFFEEFNVKIHLDPNERTDDTLAKQIAIFLVNGCSIGKLSSHLGAARGLHYHYYQNDIYCCWGKKSLEDTKALIQQNTAFKVNNIIVTGYPYSYLEEKEKLRINTIKKKLYDNGARFILLLFDNAASHNKDHEQVLPYSVLQNFYKFFLDWMIEDGEIGLIIKPKRLRYVKNLEEFNKNSINAGGRCCIVSNPVQPLPWHYSEISNMVVALSVNCIPTALISCLINNKKTRGIFFDYPNLRKLESDLYLWGENKVIFDNMNNMFQLLKKFKSNSSPSNDLGVWPKDYIKNFDAFCDRKGGYRFKNYINSLLDGFDSGFDKKKAITIANKIFSREWGSDKVLTLDD